MFFILLASKTVAEKSANEAQTPKSSARGMESSPLGDNIHLAERWKGLDLRLLPIDEVDVRILSKLRENARVTNIAIAKELDVSEATVRRRIRNLENKGIIQGYSTYLNYQLIENPVKAYIHLTVDNENRDKVVRIVVAHSRAIAVYRVTGPHDVLCVMLFVDMSELQDFLDNYLKLEGIRDVNTQIVMNPYKGVPWTGF